MQSTEYGKRVITTLIQQGIDKFCISPGSRSTPLTVAVAESPAQSWVHYDERGLGFFALGMAKSLQKPIAIIVTSGTALGNLMPAVMEAKHTHTPLLLLTADRPFELLETGANQTTTQDNLFAPFTCWSTTLTSPCKEITPKYLTNTLCNACLHLTKGPVHINIPFRKPLQEDPSPKIEPQPFSTLYHGSLELDEQSAQKWAQRLCGIEKGVVVIGNTGHTPQPILALAEKLQWPVIADLTSGARQISQSVFSYNSICEQNPKVDAVLHFGSAIVSSSYQTWISQQRPALFAHIWHNKDRFDPLHLVTDRCIVDCNSFCKKVIKALPPLKANNYRLQWHLQALQYMQKSTAFLQKHSKLTEPTVVQTIAETVTEQHAVFIGNSMPIRDADTLFFPKHPTGPIICNRGLSGIDGNIATAIGTAAATQKKTIALLGDTAFLHDLSSLGLLQEVFSPIIFVVINNQGGGIFSFLPIQEKSALTNRFFACEHPFSFSGAAKLFGIPYTQCQTKQEFTEALHSCKSLLIEIPTNREQNKTLHEQWKKYTILTETQKENVHDSNNGKNMERVCPL